MQTGLEIGVFPTALLAKYKALGLSDNDLLNVLSFFCTDTSPEKAARLRGYSSTERMRAAMRHMVDKGLLVETATGYNFIPLIQACQDSAPPKKGVFTLETGKTPKRTEHYDAYEEISACVADNKHAWAEYFKEMEASGIPAGTVIKCVKYIFSYYRAMDKDKAVVRSVFINTVRTNYDKWVAEGMPTKYQDEDVNVDEVMRLANAS